MNPDCHPACALTYFPRRTRRACLLQSYWIAMLILLPTHSGLLRAEEGNPPLKETIKKAQDYGQGRLAKSTHPKLKDDHNMRIFSFAGNMKEEAAVAAIENVVNSMNFAHLPGADILTFLGLDSLPADVNAGMRARIKAVLAAAEKESFTKDTSIDLPLYGEARVSGKDPAIWSLPSLIIPAGGSMSVGSERKLPIGKSDLGVKIAYTFVVEPNPTTAVPVTVTGDTVKGTVTSPILKHVVVTISLSLAGGTKSATKTSQPQASETSVDVQAESSEEPTKEPRTPIK